MNISVICFLIVCILSCNQHRKTDINHKSDCTTKKFSILNEALKNHLSKYYSLEEEFQYNVGNKDSLRAQLFYSTALCKGTFYAYQGKVADSNHSAAARFSVTVYEYQYVDTAIRIITDIEKEKQRRIEEREYGPLGKNYQFFLQDSIYLICLEAVCKSSEKQEWFNIQDSITKITVRHVGKNYKDVVKPCE